MGDERCKRLEEALTDLESWRRRNDWRPDREWPTEAAQRWHDGYVVALSKVALRAHRALDPEAAAEDDETWRLGWEGTDEQWYERTGHCGGCGIVADRCECDGECGCWDRHGPPPEPDPTPEESLRERVAELEQAIRDHRDGFHATLGMSDPDQRDMDRGELDARLWAVLDAES